MPKINTQNSVTIHAPAHDVFAIIRNFKQWPVWSPWLITEPGVALTYSDDGTQYSWQGKRTGSGQMKLTNETPNKLLQYDLNFIKPFKSFAQVKFMLEENGSETLVTWTMDSKLPFFLFFMKKSMEAFIGMDYQRGLIMLKELAETGSIPNKLSFDGYQTQEGTKFVGISRTCQIADVDSDMETVFNQLSDWLQQQKMASIGVPFSIYHKWDVVKGQVKYTAAMPVADAPENLPQDFEAGFLPSGKIYKITSTGPMRFLGNAWATGYAMARAKEIKIDKSRKPFELYLKDPETTPENEHITEVCFPVK